MTSLKISWPLTLISSALTVWVPLETAAVILILLPLVSLLKVTDGLVSEHWCRLSFSVGIVPPWPKPRLLASCWTGGFQREKAGSVGGISASMPWPVTSWRANGGVQSVANRPESLSIVAVWGPGAGL